MKSKQVQKFQNSNNDGIPLGSLVENFDSKRIPISKMERKNGIIPYYGASGIIDHVDDYILNGEYILVSEDGENLRSRNNPIAFLTEGKFWANNHIHVLKANEKSTNHFLVNVLNHIKIDGYLTGTAQPKLNRKNLDLILIPNFSLEEQTKIGNILYNLTKTIDNLQNQNKILEQISESIFKSWFVYFEPTHAKVKGLNMELADNIIKEFPDEFVSSEIGQIPKGWEIQPLEEVIDMYIDNRGKTPPIEEEGIPLVEVKHLSHSSQFPNLKTEKYVSKETFETWFRKHVRKNDVLISTVGTIGFTSIVYDSKMVIAQNVLGLHFSNEPLSLYMFYMIKSMYFQHQINSRLIQTVQKSFKRKDLNKIQILIPNKSLLYFFTSKIMPILNRQYENEKLISILKKTRDILMPKLMSGEIRV